MAVGKKVIFSLMARPLPPPLSPQWHGHYIWKKQNIFLRLPFNFQWTYNNLSSGPAPRLTVVANHHPRLQHEVDVEGGVQGRDLNTHLLGSELHAVVVGHAPADHGESRGGHDVQNLPKEKRE